MRSRRCRLFVAMASIALGWMGFGATEIGLAQTCGYVWNIADQPIPRFAHRAVYDPNRGAVVMYGGYVGNLTSSSELWQFGGTRWARRSSLGSSPGARNSLAMAYDEARQDIVIFGGQSSVDAQTWTLHGDQWQSRGASGPTARSSASMVYDSIRRVVVLFGGQVGSVSNAETWEWDGAAWARRLPAVSPSPRYGHGMAFDSTRGVVVVFGGFATSSNRVGDTWEWDGATWTQRVVSGPSARADVGMTFDSVRQNVLLFGGGGQGGGRLGDTWTWNGTVWTRINVTGPVARAGASCVFDQSRGKVNLFGGDCAFGTGGGADTWEWDGAAWSLAATGDPFAGRSGSRVCYDPARHETLFVGASDSTPTRLETWIWNGTNWSWRTSVGPEGRDGARLVFFPAHGKILLFGGVANSPLRSLGDSWEWDGVGWTPLSTPGPSPRQGRGLAYDSDRGVVVLFGGYRADTSEYVNDTWEFDGQTWSERASAGPSARYCVGMVYDTSRHVCYAFVLDASLQDRVYAWQWNGNAWTSSPLASPTATGTSNPVYVESSRETVLLGAPILAWNGTAWRSERTGGDLFESATYNSDQNMIIALRAVDTNVLSQGRDSSRITIRNGPFPTTGHAGGSASLTIDTSYPLAVTYRWRRDGMALVDGPRVQGATTRALVLGPLLRSDDGGLYSCELTSSCSTQLSNSARLTVRCLADMDDGTGTGTPDGGVTVDDLLYYVTIYADGVARADVDDGSGTGTPDGGVTIDDLLYYLVRFEAGC